MNYTKQGFKAKNKWSYGVFSLSVLAFFLVNAFQNNDTSIIKTHIDTWGENLTLVLMLSPFVVLLLGVFLIVKLVNGQSISTFTTVRNSIDYQRIIFAFLLWGGLSILSTLIDYFLHPTHYTWNYQSDSFWQLVGVLAILLPFQISFEEYFFRGYFWHFLGLVFKQKWVVCIISSVAFTLVHVGNPEVQHLGGSVLFIYGIIALMLGIIVLIDNGLELALGVHLANNFFSGLLVTSSWTVFQTPSIFKYTAVEVIKPIDALNQIVICLLTLFIFYKKYNWKLT